MDTKNRESRLTITINRFREKLTWEGVGVNFAIGIVFVILTLIFTLDLFVHPGKSITFDGHVHMSTIAQMFSAMKAGEFPPRWSGNFATYGFPLPLIAHQVSSYVGAFFLWVSNDVVLSYNLTIAMATFLSILCMYRWLRFFTSSLPAVLGTIFFVFAPYRIMNVYMRGAIPEFMATTWIVLLLCGVEYLVRKRYVLGSLWTGVSVALLALTHPMMLVTGGLCVGLYVVYLLINRTLSIRAAMALSISVILGFGMASYYLLPLTSELIYFNYATQSTHLREVGFLTLPQLLTAEWPYFGTSHPGPPGEAIKLGILEVGTILIALFVILTKQIHYQHKKLLVFWVAMASLFVFLITPASHFLYEHISLLSNLQYPWRWLSVFLLIPPLLLALLFEAFGSVFLLFALVGVIAVSRIPHLYGKNYMRHDEAYFYSTRENLHTANMNTVWMGNPSEYPPRLQPYDIIGGVGTVTRAQISNSSRMYLVEAETEMEFVDYTFFFPGWLVFVDGVQVPIEFQSPHYRGVITYKVPAGSHTVEVKYIHNRNRKIAMLLSILSMGTFTAYVIGLTFLQKRLHRDHL